MNFNTSDYFSYKKNKLQTNSKGGEKSLSKLNFLFQLFVATFIIIFIAIVIAIMKYSSKMDIEYSKNDAPYSVEEPEAQNFNLHDDDKKRIDKRLVAIQQEDNAPSEAKIIKENKTDFQHEVIDPIHIEKNRKIEKIEKIKAQNELAQITSTQEPVEIKNKSKQQQPEEESLATQKNVTITSKVFVGRFFTFEEAQKMQVELKTREPNSSPFVRKTGEVFCVQMGSYQDFMTARAQAQILKSKGYDVWIYQQ